MITLNNISMKYDLGIERENSFKQTFINILSFKKKKKKEYFMALDDVSFHIDKGEVVQCM